MAQWSGIRLPVRKTHETRVQSLGREDPLEEEMAILSSILAWKIFQDRGAWGVYSPQGHKKLDMNEHGTGRH